jgi:hypothetical protein
MNELPKSLKGWNDYLLITTYDYTKRADLKSMIAKEILLRSSFKFLGEL